MQLAPESIDTINAYSSPSASSAVSKKISCVDLLWVVVCHVFHLYSGSGLLDSACFYNILQNDLYHSILHIFSSCRAPLIWAQMSRVVKSVASPFTTVELWVHCWSGLSCQCWSLFTSGVILELPIHSDFAVLASIARAIVCSRSSVKSTPFSRSFIRKWFDRHLSIT